MFPAKKCKGSVRRGWRGSAIGFGWRAGLDRSPVRSAALGTNCDVLAAALAILSHCAVPKAKSLFLLIGPPTVKPNWFWLRNGTFGSKNPRAPKALFRLNSHAAP